MAHAGTHAVATLGGLIFDAAEARALPLSRAALNQCVGAQLNGARFSHVRCGSCQAPTQADAAGGSRACMSDRATWHARCVSCQAPHMPTPRAYTHTYVGEYYGPSPCGEAWDPCTLRMCVVCVRAHSGTYMHTHEHPHEHT